MSRRPRQSLRPILRLVPYFKPYWFKLALVALFSIGFAASDVGRAMLVEPLLNRALLRKSDVEGQLLDWRLRDGLDPDARAAAKAKAEAVVAPPAAQVEAIRLSERLVEPAPEGGDEDLTGLVKRTSAMLTRAGEDTPPAEEEAWSELARAVVLQRLALESLTVPDAAAEVAMASLTARAAVRELELSVVRVVLWRVFLAAVALAVALAVCHYFMHVLSRVVVARIYVDLQNRTAGHLLTLSLGYFEGERRGDLLARLTNDLALTASVITTLTSTLLIQGIHLALLAASALWISWQLCLGLGLLGLTVLAPMRWWGRKIRRSARRRQGAASDVLESMQQLFAGLREVKAFQREEYEVDRFKAVNQQATKHTEKTIHARVGSRSWVQFMNDVTVPFLFLAGGHLVIKHTWGLDAGQFGSFLGLVLLMYMPIKGLGEAYNQINDAVPGVDRVFQLFDLRPELTPPAQPVPVSWPLREGIRVENVTFAYGDQQPVLHGISFEASAGTTTAIVGQTGSGKSTLVDLLARYYDPQEGRVLIDGTPLSQLELGSYLERLAMVPQESFLFHDTVRENIRYGRLDATDAEIEDAARRARVHDELASLPGGYEFVVGERGDKLSGGQRQRVAIARALLRRPEILVLDEATSALDARTEQRVQEGLSELLRQGATTFVIAHRLSTVQEADQILVLDQGHLVERGTHQELLEKGGVYATLVSRQLEGEADLAGRPRSDLDSAPGEVSSPLRGPPRELGQTARNPSRLAPCRPCQRVDDE